MFAPYIHPESVLAPRIFLVCHSDDRLRTSSLVRAVTSFVVQGVCWCFAMPGPGVTQDEQKVNIIGLDVPSPVLFARDTADILSDSGRQVMARIRHFKGEKKLMLRAPLECDDAVVKAAKQQAGTSTDKPTKRTYGAMPGSELEECFTDVAGF